MENSHFVFPASIVCKRILFLDEQYIYKLLVWKNLFGKYYVESIVVNQGF